MNLEDGGEWGLKIQYVHQDKPLGLAHCVITAEEQLRGDSFVMYLGDNIHKGELKLYADDFIGNSSNATVLLSQVSEPREFGVAQFNEDGMLQKLVEKPQTPPSDWVMTGMYFFDETILKAVHQINPSRRNELEITDAIQWLIDHGYDVQHRKLDGWWKDTGKPDDLLEANLLVLQNLTGKIDDSAVIDDESRILGDVQIGPGAVIKRSVIRGPVVIGKGAVIENSYIGASTSLGEGSRVLRSEVSSSIIMQGAILNDIPFPIDWSLIGRDAKVHRADNRPKALNLVVGDTSRIALV